MDSLSKEGELDRLWDAESRGESYPLPESYEPVDPLEIARLADFDALTSGIAGVAAKYLVAWDGVHAETLAD